MAQPDLKVVGEIAPPDYKDPVKMLRNMADDLEAGVYGDPSTMTLAAALWGSEGLHCFGGGRDSDLTHCAYVYALAHARLVRLGLPPEGHD